MQNLETKNSRPRPRLQKTGLETRLETETKSRDSITAASLPLLRRPWICMVCKQTSPKCRFAKVNMTSQYDVTNSVYPVIMTTMRHCSILEFGRGHPIKQSPRASPDLCTPLDIRHVRRQLAAIWSVANSSYNRYTKSRLNI